MGETHEHASYVAFEVRLCGRPLPELHDLQSRLEAFLRSQLPDRMFDSDIEVELLEWAEPAEAK